MSEGQPDKLPNADARAATLRWAEDTESSLAELERLAALRDERSLEQREQDRASAKVYVWLALAFSVLAAVVVGMTPHGI